MLYSRTFDQRKNNLRSLARREVANREPTEFSHTVLESTSPSLRARRSPFGCPKYLAKSRSSSRPHRAAAANRAARSLDQRLQRSCRCEARPLVRQEAVYHGAAMVLEHHGLLSCLERERLPFNSTRDRQNLFQESARALALCTRQRRRHGASRRGLLELAVCVCPGHSGHSRCPVSF